MEIALNHGTLLLHPQVGRALRHEMRKKVSLSKHFIDKFDKQM